MIAHTTAIFRQINKDNPRAHHDALEFPDGQIVLLTHVLEGQEATVLQLPAQPATAAEAKAQERGRARRLIGNLRECLGRPQLGGYIPDLLGIVT